MKLRFHLFIVALLLCSSCLRAGTVYETASEFLAQGDYNGDGVSDVLVLDKVTGNARVGYANSSGSLTWSAALSTGVDNLTGCGVERLLKTNVDAIAVTSPAFNAVNIVDLSKTNSTPAPQTFSPMGLGPHAVVGLHAPRASISPGLPFLLVASSFNDSNSESLDLLQWTGSVAECGSFPESGAFDLPNPLDVSFAPATLALGLVRDLTNDALHVWEFDSAPGVVASYSNLVSASAYAVGTFAGQPHPSFLFYVPGESNISIVSFFPTNGGYSFGTPVNLNVSEPVQLIVFLSSNALLQFSDGVQGLTLPGGSPQLSTAYRSGAAASGNVFSGVVPLANGRFTLLDATSGAASSHAQVIDFNGTTFTVRSSSGLPSVTSTGNRADVWLFQQEPFVHRSPGFVSSLGAPDWTDSVSGLPAATDVSSETDGGVTSGLGNPSASNLGAAPSAVTFGLGNQYGSAISVFAYSPPRAAEPVIVTISPPPGSYSAPLQIQFSTSPANSGVKYRVNSVDSWRDYSGPFAITNNCSIAYYGTNTSRARASLQFAAYDLSAPYSPPPPPPIVTDPDNTNAPPVQTNEVLLSQNGTVFYGRRSPANTGSIWSINLDGSADTYITDGFKPRASHDGLWLAFLRNGVEFWLRDLASGNERKIASAPSTVTSFDWETNDTALLANYGCDIGDLNTNGIFTPIINDNCFDAMPERNPIDGSLAFASSDPDEGIHGIHFDNTSVVSSVPGASWPSWSLDGQSLAFRDSGMNLWIAREDGSALFQLSGFTDGTNGFPYGAVWLEDGLSVVFAGSVFNTNDLWVLPIRSDLQGCAGPPYRLYVSPGDPVDFAGSVVTAPPITGSGGPIPDIYIRQSPTNIIVYWQTNYSGFILESQSSVPSTNWAGVNGLYYLNGPNFEYRDANTNSQTSRFFRLHYTGAVIVSQSP
jgi:hypothetical protein